MIRFQQRIINPFVFYYNPGVSPESDHLMRSYNEVNLDISRTNSGQRLIPLVAGLDEVFVECLEEGWDGYDARPVSIGAYTDIKSFLQLLPPQYSNPDIVPEPDGGMGLEWANNDTGRFVVSFDGSGTFAYAGIFTDSSTTHGIEVIKDSLPRVIQDFINRILA